MVFSYISIVQQSHVLKNGKKKRNKKSKRNHEKQKKTKTKQKSYHCIWFHRFINNDQNISNLERMREWKKNCKVKRKHKVERESQKNK